MYAMCMNSAWGPGEWTVPLYIKFKINVPKGTPSNFYSNTIDINFVSTIAIAPTLGNRDIFGTNKT